MATSLDSFRDYQRTEAWTWEHLALTRARAIAGTPDLGAEIEGFRCTLLASDRDRHKILADVVDMRDRLDRAKPGNSVWDVKSGAGRMQDIALLAQAGALLSGAPARDVPDQLRESYAALGLSTAARDTLLAAYALFWRVQSVARLVSADAFDPDAAGEGARRFMLRETGQSDMAALAAALKNCAEDSAAHISAALREGERDGTP